MTPAIKYLSYQRHSQDLERAIQTSEHQNAGGLGHKFRPKLLVWGLLFVTLASINGALGWSVLSNDQGGLVFRLLFLAFATLALIALLPQVVEAPTG